MVPAQAGWVMYGRESGGGEGGQDSGQTRGWGSSVMPGKAVKRSRGSERRGRKRRRDGTGKQGTEGRKGGKEGRKRQWVEREEV